MAARSRAREWRRPADGRSSEGRAGRPRGEVGGRGGRAREVPRRRRRSNDRPASIAVQMSPSMSMSPRRYASPRASAEGGQRRRARASGPSMTTRAAGRTGSRPPRARARAAVGRQGATQERTTRRAKSAAAGLGDPAGARVRPTRRASSAGRQPPVGRSGGAPPPRVDRLTRRHSAGSRRAACASAAGR